MYKVSVPVMNESLVRLNRDKIYDEIKMMDGERVFLALESDCLNPEKRDRELSALKENSRWFHQKGLEVGAWLWAFMDPRKNAYTRLVTTADTDAEMPVCPLDEEFVKEKAAFITEIAETGVDMIMFDDDYRYGFQPGGFGCVCKLHLKSIGELLGETVTKEQIRHYMLHSGKNKYRDALIAANGRALENFALAMRKAVDKANPQVRLGFCACLTSWDIDGTTPEKISRILAGSTKPFYRLIGAPYWGANKYFRCRLGDVIDYERLECARKTDGEIEIFSEGDVYPRPRYRVPANYLEGFDTVLRAADCTDGILKYGVDYTMNAGYESGYAKMHQRNRKLYESIQTLFADSRATGIRVYDKMLKYADYTVPKNMEGKAEIQDLSLPAGARFLTALSLPLCFEGESGAGLAFGEDAGAVPADALANGLILDVPGALCLQKNGVDVGLEKAGEAVNTTKEVYLNDAGFVALDGDSVAIEVKLNQKAEVLSEFCTKNGNIPASYIYQNDNGQRFLVYAFDGYFGSESFFRQYQRQKQVIEVLYHFFGRPPAAVCEGNPDLYMLVKEGKNGTAVGLWNFSVDPILTPVIRLPKPIEIKSTVNCTAVVRKNTVMLQEEIAPFGFAGFGW